MRFQEHHDRILQKMMPKLKQHLVRQKKHPQNIMYYMWQIKMWHIVVLPWYSYLSDSCMSYWFVNVGINFILINALCPILTFHNGWKASYAGLFLAYIMFSICQCIGAFSEVNPSSWPTLSAHVTENSQRNANGYSLKGIVINKRQY